MLTINSSLIDDYFVKLLTFVVIIWNHLLINDMINIDYYLEIQ